MAYAMTARRRAALKKAQLASARKRRKGRRINKKISRVESRRKKRVTKYANIAQANAYTHSTRGGLYLNGRGVKAFNKGQKINAKAQRKTARLKAKKRR